MRMYTKTWIGFMCLAFFLVLSLFAGYLSPYDPDAIDLFNVEAPPSRLHPLGTDALGRDVLSRFLYGGRISLAVGFVSALLSTGIGAFLGCVSGYRGAWVDRIISRVSDIFLAFPALILAIAVSPIIEERFPHLPSVWRVILVISSLGWPPTYRLIRGEILSLKNSGFVEASRLVGAHQGWIIRKHLLPGVWPLILNSLVLNVARGILVGATLSYFGVGMRPPASSWGGLLEEAKDLVTMSSMPWLWIPPGIAIFMVVLGVNWLGRGLAERIDMGEKRSLRLPWKPFHMNSQ